MSGGWAHGEPVQWYEDDTCRCDCATCANEPKTPGSRPVDPAEAGQNVPVEFQERDMCADTSWPVHAPGSASRDCQVCHDAYTAK